MLNSSVAMRLLTVWLTFLYLTAFSPLPVSAQQGNPEIKVYSPVPGQAVQGLVEIVGNTAVDGLVGYELAFSFEEDSTQTWFVIRTSQEAIEDGTLGEWDTTSLTDGTYTLRLTVDIQGDEPTVILVDGLRVRNYTPVETDTPAPTATEIIGATATFTDTPLPPTPTSLPSNPAEVTEGQVNRALITGGILGMVLLVILGLYITARRRS
jgi:hypothetical protein